MNSQEKSSDEIALAAQEESRPMTADEIQRHNIRKEEELSQDTNQKVAKMGVQAAATAFGGPAGSAIASTVNQSGIADSVYNKIGKVAQRATDFNPVGAMAQKALNKANQEGVLDGAQAALDVVGSAGAGAAAKGAGEAAKGVNVMTKGAQAGSQAAQVGGKATNEIGQAATKVAKPAKYSVAADATIEGLDAMQQRRTSNLHREEEDVESDAEDEGVEESEDTQEQSTQPVSSPPPQDNKKESKTKALAKNKLFGFLRKHPMVIVVLIGAALLFLLFILIMAILLGGAGVSSYETAFVDTKYDFNSTKVFLTNSYTSEADKVIIDEMMLEDLIVGATYLQFYYDTEALEEAEILEVYKTFTVVAKTLALSIGKYNSETMEIEIKSGASGLPYCDPQNGCIIVENNGVYTYYPTTYEGEYLGTVTGKIPAMDSKLRELAVEAYLATKNLLVVPSSVNEVITEYTYGNPAYNSEIKDSWIAAAKTGKNYTQIINETPSYKNYQIYDITDYALQFSFASNSNSYWWPIGSSSADSKGLYSGTPVSTSVTSPFGYRMHPIDNVWKMHSGIDIGASCGTPLIAVKPGEVTKTAYDAGGYGYYVIIDHGNNIQTLYAHMLKDSFKVKVGQNVNQGQLIGSVGTTGASTGCHLHFEVRINNEKVDPLDYVSASNPRPASTISNAYVAGSSNAQSVCLSLKQSGFSDNAVAALMTNIHAESSFNPSVLGDSGTSIGLCQWHNGRYTNLMNYCGSDYKTIACQLDFLMYELTTSYKGVYNSLLSNNSAYDIANQFCLEFERPSNKHVKCPARASNYAAGYLRYVQSGCNG